MYAKARLLLDGNTTGTIERPERDIILGRFLDVFVVESSAPEKRVNCIAAASNLGWLMLCGRHHFGPMVMMPAD